MGTEGGIAVGLWPGKDYAANRFIQEFRASLISAGCDVHDISDWRQIPEGIHILHANWPEMVFWGTSSLYRRLLACFHAFLAILRLRWKGVKIVWTVHNLIPHDVSGYTAPSWRLLEYLFSAAVDGWMTLSPSTAIAVGRDKPWLRGKPHGFCWHPLYTAIIPRRTKEEARAIMSLDPEVRLFVFAGRLRKYKEVETFLRGFATMPGRSCRAVISGYCRDAKLRARIRDLCAQDERIDFREGWLSDADYELLLDAADFVVVPSQATLHSGSVVHALSRARPVIAPATLFARDLAVLLGSEWVQCYEEALSPDVLDGAPVPSGEPDLALFGGQNAGITAVAAYASVLGAKPRSAISDFVIPRKRSRRIVDLGNKTDIIDESSILTLRKS